MADLLQLTHGFLPRFLDIKRRLAWQPALLIQLRTHRWPRSRMDAYVLVAQEATGLDVKRRILVEHQIGMFRVQMHGQRHNHSTLAFLEVDIINIAHFHAAHQHGRFPHDSAGILGMQCHRNRVPKAQTGLAEFQDHHRRQAQRDDDKQSHLQLYAPFAHQKSTSFRSASPRINRLTAGSSELKTSSAGASR